MGRLASLEFTKWSVFLFIDKSAAKMYCPSSAKQGTKFKIPMAPLKATMYLEVKIIKQILFFRNPLEKNFLL